jgi:hypothetical protein
MIRGFGLVATMLLLVISIFALTHLQSTPSSQDAINLWRGLAATSLFVFLCVPTSHRRH